jgi:hypothetical protein
MSEALGHEAGIGPQHPAIDGHQRVVGQARAQLGRQQAERVEGPERQEHWQEDAQRQHRRRHRAPPVQRRPQPDQRREQHGHHREGPQELELQGLAVGGAQRDQQRGERGQEQVFGPQPRHQ